MRQSSWTPWASRSRASATRLSMVRLRKRRTAAQLDQLPHLAQLVEPHEAVDLGDLPRQVGAEAVDHAAGDEHLLDPLALLPHHFEDGVDRLLLCLLDEGAGVDDDGLGALQLGDDLIASAGELPQHHLAVDEVLGAAQADHAHPGALGDRGHGGGSLTEWRGRAFPAGTRGTRPYRP